MVPFVRDPSVFSDLRTLVRLWFLFRRERFDLVHSSTPKAGLLCALAGFLAGIPVRIHSFTGQRWVTESGIKREVLRMLDRLIAFLCTKVYADSRSQMEFLIKNGVVAKNDISVIGAGSLGGVNFSRYSSSSLESQSQLLIKFGIEPTRFKFLYVGRLNRDKGIQELITAFESLDEQCPDSAVLVLVGPREVGSGRLSEDVISAMESHRAIFEIGFVDGPQIWFDTCDVQVLPSYREGFGTVVLEAALSGMPTIGTNIYGLKDAIVDQKTGELVEVKNGEALFQAMKRCVDDTDAVKQYGINARERVVNDFGYEKIASDLLNDYESMLGQ